MQRGSNRWLVCAGEQETRFALGEPTSLPVAADRAMRDSNLAVVATDAEISVEDEPRLGMTKSATQSRLAQCQTTRRSAAGYKAAEPMTAHPGRRRNFAA